MKIAARSSSRVTLEDCLGLLGAAAVAIGAGMIYLPAGVIVGGLELLLAAGMIAATGKPHAS